jgi:hypothetical protein
VFFLPMPGLYITRTTKLPADIDAAGSEGGECDCDQRVAKRLPAPPDFLVRMAT